MLPRIILRTVTVFIWAVRLMAVQTLPRRSISSINGVFRSDKTKKNLNIEAASKLNKPTDVRLKTNAIIYHSIIRR